MYGGVFSGIRVCLYGEGVQVKAGVRGLHACVPGNTKLKIKPRLSFRWTCNPDIKPWSSTHLFTPSLHTPLPLSSTPSEHILHPPRGVDPTPLHGAHLQVCEGRRPTKADCVLIKFIICGELILNGNLSPSSPKGKLDYSLAIIPMKLLGFSLCCTADGNRLFF